MSENKRVPKKIHLTRWIYLFSICLALAGSSGTAWYYSESNLAWYLMVLTALATLFFWVAMVWNLSQVNDLLNQIVQKATAAQK